MERTLMGKTKVVLELTDHEVARRLLMHQTPVEIAQATGLKPDTVKNRMRHPDFQAVLANVRDKAYEGLDQLVKDEKRNIKADIDDIAGASFDRLKHLLTAAKSETVQMNVAHDFLDRAGHGKQQERTPMVNINIGHIEADVITTALKREQEGRERLEHTKVVELAVPAKQLEHPVVKNAEHDTVDEPTEGPESES